MKRSKLVMLVGSLLVGAMLLAACPAPAAPAAESAPESAAAEAAPAEEVIEIEYWQYNFAARVDAMDQLIAQFEEANPNIKVVHNADIPYAEFRDKIAASVPAGVGPDVATALLWLAIRLDRCRLPGASARGRLPAGDGR